MNIRQLVLKYPARGRSEALAEIYFLSTGSGLKILMQKKRRLFETMLVFVHPKYTLSLAWMS